MLANLHPNVIAKLESIFAQPTAVYIDYANVRPWSTKLGWHIELKRLKQFLDSFDNIKSVSLYNGYISNNPDTQTEISEYQRMGYKVRTKSVKIMRLNIDASSIQPISLDLLKQFIRPSLLAKYNPKIIELLNQCFSQMNKRGEYFIEDKKCNFDVEIGTDMLLDYERGTVETFVLWSGDSDFADTIQRLLEVNKKVCLFATSRRVARELSELEKRGLFIFDIKMIKEFICWKREMTL